MPQLLDRLSHKRRKRQLLLRDQILEIPRDPVPATNIEMTTAIRRTITTEGTIIAAATTIAATTITVVTKRTIGKMTIVGTIIATDDHQGTTNGTKNRNMYARSDGLHPTTIGGGPALQGLNHRVRRSNKNDNWYQ